MRRQALERLVASAAAGLAAPATLAFELPPDTGDPVETLDLWPNGPPGGDAVTVRTEIVERENPWKLRDRIIRCVRTPRLTVFRAVGRPRGALLLLPGGGYTHVVIDKEGFEIARWFASQGFTTFVLFYRLPADGWSAGPDAPLQDAQRALRLIRSRASEWHLEPGRLGIVGFSAGGHLAARMAGRHSLRTYEPVDEADRTSARPDAVAMLYPVITLEGAAAHAGSRENLLGRSPPSDRSREYSGQTGVGTGTPPSFLLHAADDTAVPLDNSLLMYGALRAAGVPTELHVFAEGGHGFGLRAVANRPVAVWPALLRDWAVRCFEQESVR
jgi:acetyl esterase/lipase